jgi:DNA-binding MarR family transcriptional regulator
MTRTIPDEPTDDVGAELRVAVVRLYRRLRAERAEGPGAGLGDTHFAVLNAIVKRGPYSLRELSDLERVSPPSMNQTVNLLEQRGYVTRRADERDGRKVLLVPTSEGKALVAEVRRHRNAWLDDRLDTLTAAERAALLKAARLLRDLSDS